MSREPVILVGVDGSDASYQALDWAVAEAKKLSWRLHIVCVYSLPSFSATSIDGGYAILDDSQIVAGAQSVVADAVQRAGTQVEVSSAVEAGDPTTVMAELSKDAGLIVIGKHRGSGVADRLLGAVSSSLPPLAHCPTVVVPFMGADAPVKSPVKKIVVGVDNSDSARCALKHAIREAELWDAQLTAFSAIALVQGAGAMAWVPTPIDHDELLTSVREGLSQTVDEVLGDKPLKVECRVLDGSAAALLTEFSTAVDLIVVGTRGRGGFTGLLLGSTSQTVMARSSCPVMVVPSRVDKDLPSSYPWEK